MLPRSAALVLLVALAGCLPRGGVPGLSGRTAIAGTPAASPATGSGPLTVSGPDRSAFLPGDSLAIAGSGWGTTPTDVQVLFRESNRVEAVAPSIATSQALQVTVPAGLKGGVLQVVRGKERSPLFPYTCGLPSIATASATAGSPGSEVVLVGQHFSPVLAENRVWLGTEPLEVVGGSLSSLVVKLAGRSGDLVIETGAGRSAALSVTVIPPIGGNLFDPPDSP
jgi:hypothetical protein